MFDFIGKLLSGKLFSGKTEEEKRREQQQKQQNTQPTQARPSQPTTAMMGMKTPQQPKQATLGDTTSLGAIQAKSTPAVQPQDQTSNSLLQPQKKPAPIPFQREVPKVLTPQGQHDWRKKNQIGYSQSNEGQKNDQLYQKVDTPQGQKTVRDLPMQGGKFNGQSIGSITDLYNKAKGMDQVNLRRDIETEIKGLGEDFSDASERRKYQLGLSMTDLQDQKKKSTFGSIVNEVGNALFVKPLTSTGEGLAGLIDVASGRKQKLSEELNKQAGSWYDSSREAQKQGKPELAQYLASQGDEKARESQRAIGSQIEGADPIKAAGTVATAVAMPFAFGAQGAGTSAALKMGATGATSRAATTSIGKLVETASPVIKGRLGSTAAGKLMNSTPVEIVTKALPNASPKLQAVAGESVANVLSGVAMSPGMTASQLGSSGKLEDYLIEAATGAAIDAAFPFAAYGAGKLARGTYDGAKALKSGIDEVQISNYMSQGLSREQAVLRAQSGFSDGFIAGPGAVGFNEARLGSRVFEGVDGMPRFEVDDSTSRLSVPLESTGVNPNRMRALDTYEKARLRHLSLNPDSPEGQRALSAYSEAYSGLLDNPKGSHTLGDVLDHQNLFSQYPELRNTPVLFEPMPAGSQGSLDGDLIRINSNMPVDEQRKTLMHEIQHVIQEREGFARGGNSGMAPEGETLSGTDLKEYLDLLEKEAFDGKLSTEESQRLSRLKDLPSAHQWYQRLAGEVEARNVESRIDYPDSHRYQDGRSTFEDSVDVPRDKQVVRTDEAGTSLSERQIRNHPEIAELDRKFDELAEEIETLRRQGRAEGYPQVLQKRKSQNMIIDEQQAIADRLGRQGLSMSTSEDSSGAAVRVDENTRRRLIRNEVDNLIYEENPELLNRALYSGLEARSLSEDGSATLPRIHTEDLRHYLGNVTESIPAAYKRRDGARDLDLIAQRAGFDDIDDYMGAYMLEVESRSNDKAMLAEMRNLRKDPNIRSMAEDIVNGRIENAKGDIDKLRSERRKSMMINDESTIASIDEAIQKKASEMGIKNVKPPKRRQIDVKGPQGKVSEYVAVNTLGTDGKNTVELVPLDGSKHTMKNGMVVDKSGKSVGSYVGIDELGNQYAYLEGKPINITGIVGDIDAWGNLNKASWDMDRLIEANAPDKQTARKVQEFTTVYKDRQEATMKAELVQRRLKLQEIESDLTNNTPSGISKKELTKDLFMVMEKKTSYNQILDKYGKEYVEKYMKPAIQWARKDLDDTLDETNKVLIRNGFDEIPRRDNYITHIQEDPSFWSKVGVGIQDILPLGKSIDSDINPGKVRGGVPDEIVGNTANTSARRKWNPFAQERKGSQHQQDFFAALDAYYEPMLFNKYITPAASRTRMVERVFRTFEEAKKMKFEQMAEIVGIDEAGKAESAAVKTNKNYKAGRRSPLIVAWQEYGNMLAGKTNALDRAIIDNLGKGGEALMQTSTKFQGIAGANTIPGSATAALAQSLSIPQTIGRDSMGSFLKATKDMMRFDGFRKGSADPMQRSSFMRSRYTDATSNRLTKVQKYTKAASIPMEAIERFTGEISWRSAYHEAVKSGQSGMDAVRTADIAAKKTLAGRGIGDRPLAMNSKALGALTQFGLEVNNMRIQFFKDFDTTQKVKFMLSAYALNQAYQWVTGQTPLPDYVDAMSDAVRDFAEEPELDDDGNEKRGLLDKVGSFGQRMLGETAKFVPGAGPLANLLPEKVKEGLFGSDSDVARFGTMAASRVPEAMWKAFEGVLSGNANKVIDAGLMVAPTGQQARRSLGGLETMNEGVSRTGSGNVNTEVDNTNPLKWLQAGVFGKNALHEVQGVYDNKAFATNKDQTATYEEIRKVGGEEQAKAYLRSIRGVGGDMDKKTKLEGSAEATKTLAQAKLKIDKGDWREENGLMVSKSGEVQRSYYKSLAKSSDSEDDETYNNWMKGYNIDGASNRAKAKKQANPTLAALESQSDKIDKASTAISFMKNSEKFADLPEWAKERYYKEASFSKLDVEYGAKASYNVNEKLDGYWRPLAQNSSKEELTKQIVEGRRLSIDGENYWATTGIVDKLQKEGFLSKSEAKQLKAIKLDSKGAVAEKASGSGSGSGSGAKSAGGLSALLKAYETTTSLSAPKTSAPANTGNMQTKKTLAAAPLKKWNGATGEKKATKVVARNR